jgi:hypothetical protein
MSKVSFKGNIVTIEGKEIPCEHTIEDALESKDVVVVFLDPDAEMGKPGKYQNIIGFDSTGKQLWKAELPPSEMQGDTYYKIAKRKPLVAYSCSSYECELDLLTGKIVGFDYFK